MQHGSAAAVDETDAGGADAGTAGARSALEQLRRQAAADLETFA